LGTHRRRYVGELALM